MQRDAISVAPRKGASCGYLCDQANIYVLMTLSPWEVCFFPRKVGNASYANAAAALVGMALTTDRGFLFSSG